MRVWCRQFSCIDQSLQIMNEREVMRKHTGAELARSAIRQAKNSLRV